MSGWEDEDMSDGSADAPPPPMPSVSAVPAQPANSAPTDDLLPTLPDLMAVSKSKKPKGKGKGKGQGGGGSTRFRSAVPKKSSKEHDAEMAKRVAEEKQNVGLGSGLLAAIADVEPLPEGDDADDVKSADIDAVLASVKASPKKRSRPSAASKKAAPGSSTPKRSRTTAPKKSKGKGKGVQVTVPSASAIPPLPVAQSVPSSAASNAYDAHLRSALASLHSANAALLATDPSVDLANKAESHQLLSYIIHAASEASATLVRQK